MERQQRAPGLNENAVRNFSAKLYGLDGRISLQRARVMGSIIDSLSIDQRASLDALVGTGVASWPNAIEPPELAGLTGDEKVAVMTYGGDLFSWYAGSVDADVYFCPERQGTYFGSFYLKDGPAVGNPGCSIGTNITGDYGKAFLDTLTSEQAQTITNLVDAQRSHLNGIVDVRRSVSTDLRRAMTGFTIDGATVRKLMAKYGRLDGSIVSTYAMSFVAVGRSLTSAESTQLMDLRHQLLGDLQPQGAFLYAQPIGLPTVRNTDSLFK